MGEVEKINGRLKKGTLVSAACSWLFFVQFRLNNGTASGIIAAIHNYPLSVVDQRN